MFVLWSAQLTFLLEHQSEINDTWLVNQYQENYQMSSLLSSSDHNVPKISLSCLKTRLHSILPLRDGQTESNVQKIKQAIDVTRYLVIVHAEDC